MRNKIFGSIAVFAVVAITVFNTNLLQKDTVQSLMLANIEALADIGEAQGNKMVSKKSESETKTKEKINGVMMECKVRTVECDGVGDIYCTNSYSKNCSE